MEVTRTELLLRSCSASAATSLADSQDSTVDTTMRTLLKTPRTSGSMIFETSPHKRSPFKSIDKPVPNRNSPRLLTDHGRIAAPFRKHATSLSTCLQGALMCIDHTHRQPVPADLLKVLIHGALTLVLKALQTRYGIRRTYLASCRPKPKQPRRAPCRSFPYTDCGDCSYQTSKRLKIGRINGQLRSN